MPEKINPEDRKDGVIVISGNQTWAWGSTVDDAKKRAKSLGADLTTWIAVKLPEGTHSAHVDDMGTIRWVWATPPEDNHPLALERVGGRGRLAAQWDENQPSA